MPRESTSLTYFRPVNFHYSRLVFPFWKLKIFVFWKIRDFNFPIFKDQFPGRSIMQRLSNWFEDHLPLRKRDHVRRSEKRKASKSVTAPRMRYTVSNAQKQNDRILDQLPFAGNGPHSMSVSMIGKNSIFDDGYTGKWALLCPLRLRHFLRKADE